MILMVEIDKTIDESKYLLGFDFDKENIYL